MRTIVTGAARGIGRAVCRRLAQDARRSNRPAHIAAVDRAHEDELEALLAELREEGVEATPFMGDLGDPEEPARIVAEAAGAMGGIDALVSNAGLAAPAPLTRLRLDEWDLTMNVNTRATWLLGKAAHPHLKESGGAIAVTASMSGMNPHSGMGAYSASKAGVIGLTRQMALQYAGRGVRVTAVCPGNTLTPFTRGPMGFGRAADPAAAQAAQAERMPLGRSGEPEEIAAAIAYLASEEASFVIGSVLDVDGGSNLVSAHVAPGTY